MMPSSSSAHAPHPIADKAAKFIVARPWFVVLALLFVGAVATWGTTRLRINANQLDLISQDLREVKDVKRIIDMVGGSGFLMVTLRSDDEAAMKKVADDLANRLQSDHDNVRSLTYRMPVAFAQQNMVLFVQTEDLKEIRKRTMGYLRELVRRANPFFIELRATKPPQLDIQEFVDKYSHVGKKTILDEYYISEDRKMLMLLIKPMWDTNELGKTHDYIDRLHAMLAEYSTNNPAGVNLVEDYALMGNSKTIAYGFAGSYKTSLDDSYAIKSSLEPVSIWAFCSILGITILFFRKLFPSLIVIVGMVLGTILTMGFTYATVGTLNMITSILGGILMGFGVDYGIHFIFRTRIELGSGKHYKEAIYSALINAGRPALVAAVVTGGSFFVLMISQFRGFSQFGFLAGFGTLIIGFTMFSWTAAVLVILGNYRADLPERLIGKMSLKRAADGDVQPRIARPKMLLAGCLVVVAALCACAIPWAPVDKPAGANLSWAERLRTGVRFNYNTRALMAEDQYSVKLQDEINRRFKISSDPIAIYTKDLDEARELYDELKDHPQKYPSIDQVMSIWSFVPPAATARANAEVLRDWREELKDFDLAVVPPEYKAHTELFFKALDAKPFDVHGVPEIYAAQFYNLPQTRPENRGILTFVYPRVDLWDGQQMLRFADEVNTITCASGRQYHGAGSPLLYAALARMVLADGKLTVLLATLWILVMHFLDFRNVKLALASVLPLGIGLVMMLGLMALTQHPLNFMNIIILPILLGFGVSHGLYLLHRYLEGTSPVVAFRSVGAAVASSTLTAIAGFASLFAASHNGLKSMGYVACLGLTTTLVVSFTVLAAVLQLMYDAKQR
jgi:predicted RND superfamily exporter protein